MPPPSSAPRGNAPLQFASIPRVATLSTQVAAQLENVIVNEHLGAGARLPTERDLAVRFQVSRTVVREAVRGLVAQGVLQVTAGSGTIITRPSAQTVTQSMSHYLRLGDGGVDHEKITEVRRLLEIEIAALAAERRTEEDLAGLHRLLADFENVRSNRTAFAQWDVGFHRQIAAATHNEILVLLLDSISGVMTKVREIGFEVPGSASHALRHHTAILKEIARGSATGARKAMRAHIEHSEKVMTSARADGRAKSKPKPRAA